MECIEFNDWSIEKFTGGFEYLYFYPMHVWSASADVLREVIPLEAAGMYNIPYQEGMAKCFVVVYQEMHARRSWGSDGFLIPCRPMRKYLIHVWTYVQLAIVCAAILEQFPMDTNYHVLFAQA